MMLLYLCVLSSLSTASPLEPPCPVHPPSPIDQPSPGYPLSSPIPCPSSWYDSGLSGLGCLLFHTSTAFTWEEANSFCQEEEGGVLVEVWTEAQHTALRMVLGLVEEHDSAARYCYCYLYCARY